MKFPYMIQSYVILSFMLHPMTSWHFIHNKDGYVMLSVKRTAPNILAYDGNPHGRCAFVSKVTTVQLVFSLIGSHKIATLIMSIKRDHCATSFGISFFL